MSFWERLSARTTRFIETSKKVFYYGWIPFMLFHAYKAMRQPSIVGVVTGLQN